MDPGPPPARWSRLAALAAALVLLGIGIRDVWPWFADDAWISLRYAERWVAGHGLTWNDGERVEGYSNLLWIAAVAGLHLLGFEWVAAARGLALGCTVATLALLVFRPWPGTRGDPAVVVLASLCATAVWAIGGLEAPLTMLCVAFALQQTFAGLLMPAAGNRRFGAAGVALALSTWTRPDAPFWVAAALAAILLANRLGAPTAPRAVRWRQLCAVGALPLAAVLLQLLFRLVYYGELVPNTARVKATVSAASVRTGLEYVASCATALRALLLPAAVGLVLGLARARTRLAAAVGGAAVVLWAVYLALVGGDVFPQSRMLMPAMPVLVQFAGIAFAALPRHRAGTALRWTIAALLCLLARHDAARRDADRRQQLSAWEWLGEATGRWLGAAFAPQRPLLAIDAAGAVPFYSRLQCLDLLGLCDRHIARVPQSTALGFTPGHQCGDGRYALERAPDIVLFGQPPGFVHPQFRSGIEMEQDPSFLRDYRCTLFRTGPQRLGDGSVRDVKVSVYLRLAGRLGVQVAGDRVVVPGYCFASYRHPYAFRLHAPPPAGREDLERYLRDTATALAWWQAEGVLGVLDERLGVVVGEVRKPGPHVLREVRVPAGRWIARCVGDAAVDVRIHGAGGADLPRDGDAVIVDGPIDIELVTGPGAVLPGRVEHVELRR